VIDTASDEVLHSLHDPDPWPTNGMAYSTRMAVSRDGSRLFRFKITTLLRVGDLITLKPSTPSETLYCPRLRGCRGTALADSYRRISVTNSM
jgi:hypothetical protein